MCYFTRFYEQRKKIFKEQSEMAKANDGHAKLESGRDNSKPIIILKVS